MLSYTGVSTVLTQIPFGENGVVIMTASRTIARAGIGATLTVAVLVGLAPTASAALSPSSPYPGTVSQAHNQCRGYELSDLGVLQDPKDGSVEAYALTFDRFSADDLSTQHCTVIFPSRVGAKLRHKVTGKAYSDSGRLLASKSETRKTGTFTVGRISLDGGTVGKFVATQSIPGTTRTAKLTMPIGLAHS